MIDNYSIISGESYSKRGALIELVREVRALVEYGWQPLGAPFYLDHECHRDGSMHVFCQAIVKSSEGK